MPDKTGIEWTDATWNPIRGCSRVSEGCRNCYAEKTAFRFSGPGQPYEGLVQFDSAISLENARRIPNWNGQIKFVEEHLLDPLRWKNPRRIFVNSMSDLFHENVTDEMLDRIFAVMALCPQHTFQVLTKRPARMLAYLEGACGRIADRVMKMRKERNDRCCIGPLPHIAPGAVWWPIANVWLGVSVENQKAADERIPLLLQAPAAKRFISAEPLLGAVVLGAYGFEGVEASLDWVICGGESGPGARPMHPDWARGLRDQCVTAGVPFFFKQWGEWCATEKAGEINTVRLAVLEGAHIRGRNHAVAFGGEDLPMFRVGKKAAGHLLDGKEWHQFPAAVAHA